MKIVNCICGGDAKLNEYPEMPMVYCVLCGSEGTPWAKRSEAIKAWNNYQKKLREVAK